MTFEDKIIKNTKWSNSNSEFDTLKIIKSLSMKYHNELSKTLIDNNLSILDSKLVIKTDGEKSRLLMPTEATEILLGYFKSSDFTSKTPPYRIAFTGMSATGKSTIIKELAEHFKNNTKQSAVTTLDSKSMSDVYDLVNHGLIKKDMYQRLRLANMITRDIQSLSIDADVILYDRIVNDTIPYSKSYKDYESYNDVMSDNSMYDVIFHITIDNYELEKRLRSRKTKIDEDIINDAKELNKTFTDGLYVNAFYNNVISIDANDLSLETVLKYINTEDKWK